MPRQPLKQYALYKGERHLFTGTVRQIAEFHNITEQTIRYYATPSYKKNIFDPCKHPAGRYIVIPLDRA